MLIKGFGLTFVFGYLYLKYCSMFDTQTVNLGT